jgi:hypothetical protein
MKPLLIAVSLLVNVALVAAFAVRPALVPSAFRDYFTFGAGSGNDDAAARATTAKSKAAPRPSAAERPKLWTALHTEDLAALVARLRAAGFPIYTIRAIVQNELNSRYDARMRALSQSDPDAPFWKSTASLGMDAKRMAEYSQLSSERSKLMRELLGNYLYHDSGTLSTAEVRRYGSLPQSKIDQLERINADYSDLTNQVRAAMNGITLPEDREKLALLEREKRADLVALLTPDELADYDMRNSPVTARLRQTFDLFKVTEDEFRAIYAIQQAYSDRIDLNATTFPTMTPEQRNNFMQQRTAAQKELDAQMQAALGDARYAEFVRASDREFQQLNRLAEQANLPAQAAVQAYNLRDQLSQESNRIFNDTTLSYDQKLSSLQSLAQNTRAQLIATLGPVAGETYVKSANWLANVERGAAVTFSGTSTSIRGLPNPNASTRVSGSVGGGIGGAFYLGDSGGVIATGTGGGVITTSGGGGGAVITTSSGGTLIYSSGGDTIVTPTTSTVIIREGTTTIASPPAAPAGPPAPPSSPTPPR